MNKKYFLITILLLSFLNSDFFSQSWGTRIFSNIETNYEIYKQNFAYTDSAFLITDIRNDTVAQNINSFNIQNLNVYRPYDGNEYLVNTPVVFFVHGGGWTDGYASQYDFMSISLTGDKGWTLVSIDYRLTSDSVFIADEFCPNRDECSDTLNRTKAAWYPDNINDVAAAFTWTIENIEFNGGDTSKIFILGHSAGGHLISLLAVHPDFEFLRPYIKGAISISGAYEVKSLSYAILGEAIEQTFQGGYFNNDAELDEASPITYITSSFTPPPFYLLHCQVDLPSLPQQKTLFLNKLSSYGYDVEADFLPGFSHKSEIAAFAYPDSLPTILVTDYIQNRLNAMGTENNDYKIYDFELHQNYPNPFNPATVISYTLPSAQNIINGNLYQVMLKIYNPLGEEVATLINEKQPPGKYSVNFYSHTLSSGIYFYKLIVNGKMQTKKLVIMK